VVDRFHAFIDESLGIFSCCIDISQQVVSEQVSLRFTIISIRAIASKMTTTTKFEMQIFDGKLNFFLWKMRVTALLVKEGTHKALLSVEKKPLKIEDDEWNDIEFCAKAMIILYISDEVLYNIMNEKITSGLWCKLESLYMTKSLSNKLFMKKQLYNLRMKEDTPILQHLNAFNRILSNLLALEVKLEEEEDKTLLLLSSFPSSYDHVILQWGKTSILSEIAQILIVEWKSDACQTNSPTLARYGDGLGYIKI